MGFCHEIPDHTVLPRCVLSPQSVQRRDKSIAKSDKQMGIQKEETGINYSDRLLLEIEIAS